MSSNQIMHKLAKIFKAKLKAKMYPHIYRAPERRPLPCDGCQEIVQVNFNCEEIKWLCEKCEHNLKTPPLLPS